MVAEMSEQITTVYYNGAAYKVIEDKGNRLMIQHILLPKIIRMVYKYEIKDGRVA